MTWVLGQQIMGQIGYIVLPKLPQRRATQCQNSRNISRHQGKTRVAEFEPFRYHQPISPGAKLLGTMVGPTLPLPQ